MFVVIWIAKYMCFGLKGLPNVGTNAGAGSLDFLRNSQQVKVFMSIFTALTFW